MITRLDIENYRSVRRLTLELGGLNVAIGANGAGKSNLYRALELLRSAAEGDLARRLAAEGGLDSALWAGAGRKGPVRLSLSVEIDTLRYDLSLGPPRPTDAALALDPIVKEETVSLWNDGRWISTMDRRGPNVSVRDESGKPRQVASDIWLFETALSSLSEPTRYPELMILRRRLLEARFYHQFRTDPDSPLRRPQPKIATPSVASDGMDWATALYSRLAIADSFEDLDRSPAARAIASAFPDTRPAFFENGPELEGGLQTTEFERPFRARELSDGTLRFLVLTAALTALRPPSFMAINEPEASLHPSLIEPLADLIGDASERTQIMVVTHSAALAKRLENKHHARILHFEKEAGETRLI
ncbi:MAG: AAA family ATPase [Rhodobacteraceae bacterium]|nr:AAA family ATPase [Paracoccaceae bacterium]